MAGLYPNDASIIDSVGRLMIVGPYIYFGIRNITPWHVEDHIKRLTAFRTP
ncbi:MAG: hypothetical protein JO205_11695, partial [Pseudolabrys sp.]|nr:hypothetical protein [Pseudolabrys sp.]